MSELENIGITGPNYLKETLTNCSDPMKAIEEFQEENSILLPSLKPALHFLDLHSLSRSDFHSSVVEVLKDALIKQITELGSVQNESRQQDRLNELLDKTFVVIKNKTLRPVAMHVMKYVPDIKIEYLAKIEKDPELYKEAPVEAKRQIWQQNQHLFSNEVMPLLSAYIQQKDSQLCDVKSRRSIYHISPKSRRGDDIISKLVEMIGHNIELYDMILQFLRSMFMRNKLPHYCTLRCDILMALHENEVNDICSMDPSHKFAWCLDACIRENFVDSKRAKELLVFLDGIKKGQEEVLGDLAMVLADPYALHTCCCTILKILQQLSLSEKMPRDNSDLILILRMINLGLSAGRMMDTSIFKESRMDASLVTEFLPDIQLLMLEEQVRTASLKLPKMFLEAAAEISPSLSKAIIDSDVAAYVATFTAGYVLESKEPLLFAAILEILQEEGDIAYSDILLHHLVNEINSNIEQLVSAGNLTYVIDAFFMRRINRETMEKHIMRLFWLIHKKISKTLLIELLSRLSLDEIDESLQGTYQTLQEYSESVDISINTMSDDSSTPSIGLSSPAMGLSSPAMGMPSPSLGLASPFHSMQMN